MVSGNGLRIQVLNQWPPVHTLDPGITRDETHRCGNDDLLDEILRRVKAYEEAEQNRLRTLASALGHSELRLQIPQLRVVE